MENNSTVRMLGWDSCLQQSISQIFFQLKCSSKMFLLSNVAMRTESDLRTVFSDRHVGGADPAGAWWNLSWS